MAYISITSYDENGEVGGIYTLPVGEELQQDFSFIYGNFDGDKYYVVDGNPVEFPEKPPHSRWDWQTKSYVQDTTLAKAELLRLVSTKYGKVSSGTDPETNESIYVDCLGYRMNAGADAATKMDGGVRLAEQLGLTQMDVRDFYNVNHTVDIADAKTIRNQQAADAHNYWLEKCAMVDAINTATTVAEVEAVNTQFTVNVE